MAFTQQGNFTFLHSSQPDNLSSIMSASQIKSSFDSQANELKTTLNKLIVDLGSTTANTSGASNVGASTISGLTGTNVQALLESLNTLKLGTTGGTVSGGLTVTGILQSSNSLRADVSTTGQTTLVLKNSVDDAYLRIFTTAANTYIASSNYGSTASRDLLITGYSGNALGKLSLLANTTAVSGALTVASGLAVTGGISATSDITEKGSTLENRYLPTTFAQNYGFDFTIAKQYPRIVFTDLDPSYSNQYALTGYQNKLSVRVNGATSSNEIYNFNYNTGLVAARSGITYTSVGTTGQAVFDANNSDLIGLNGLHFNDACDSIGEGLMFMRSSGANGSTNKVDYDNFRVLDNFIYLDVANNKASKGFGMNSVGNATLDSLATNTTTNAANMYSSATGVIQRSTSSIKYKENVEDLWEEEYEKVLDLRPVYYKSKGEADRKDWGYIGLIAEEVNEIQPKLVTYKQAFVEERNEIGDLIHETPVPKEELECEHVQYERLAVMLIPIIKKQRQQIADLEARLSKLEGEK